ncbi:Flp family type IVb pilin [Desulfofundulus salinus]|uniref:Flp family type IVb pilin n=1 Tax=Desulfofundulus salinus TaxID=2419843 RepID=A0A494WWV8_9FIRM|nr:Flp family type IVb pilin [Desulfofundulus salinum]
MKTLASKFHRDQSGGGIAEYGLILALVAVVCIAALTALGVALVNKFNRVKEALDSTG